MKWSILCFTVGLLLNSVSSFGEVYKWTDKQGRVHYGDKPPAHTQAEDLSDTLIINSFEGADVRPNEFFDAIEKTRSEEARTGEKHVVMYSTTWCGVCKKARRYFQEKNIPFKEYDVEKSARGKADYARMQGRGVPIILIGKQRMNGFNAPRFDQIYYAKP